MESKPMLVALINERLYSELFPQHVLEGYQRHFELVHRPYARSGTEIVEALQGAAGCITSWGSPRITGDVLQQCRKLRVIGHAAGSVKAVVDDSVWEHDIVVVNANHVIAQYVGEMALLLALALLRCLPQQNAVMHQGGWREEPWSVTDTLFGKTVGLIGFGATAKAFVAVLRPFSPRLLIYDPYADPRDIADYGGEATTFERLLSESDIVSLHAPSVPETRGMMSRSALAAMRDGALLINTARGALLDEDALVDELKSRRLRAALDVYSKEPLPQDHPLRGLPNCILTPHLAGPVATKRWRMAAELIEPLAEYLIHGVRPKHAVCREELETSA